MELVIKCKVVPVDAHTEVLVSGGCTVTRHCHPLTLQAAAVTWTSGCAVIGTGSQGHANITACGSG